MSEHHIINITSDEEIDYDYDYEEEQEEEEDSEIEIVEFRNVTQQLIDNPTKAEENKTYKKLSDIQCPICFDDITKATVTSCGHVFCLECIAKSISSSHARGQVGNSARGRGLCPLCRKQVTFKETTLMRIKKAQKVGKPSLPEK